MNCDLKIEITKERHKILSAIFKQNKSFFIISDNCFITDIKHKDFIIDSINNYFNRYGLQNNYEPNSLGVQLENLLDLFLKNLSEN